MFPDFLALRGLFKIEHVKIDSNVFRCHYKLTVIILVISSVIVSLAQYVGDPIDCFLQLGKPPFLGNGYFPNQAYDVLDDYCWIHSTFTLPDEAPARPSNNRQNEIDKLPGMGAFKKGDPIIHHKYYQWVGFFLMFQAVCFYMPRRIWKAWEGGKMKILCADMTSVVKPSPVVEEDKRRLVTYFFASLKKHKYYAACYFFCELLTFINIIGQIYFIDTFLGGQFTQYGTNVIKQSLKNPEHRTDPMSKVFPKVSKCTFKNYGTSGTLQTHDAFCVLQINILNEKIFIFLWFWFIILSVVTAISLFIRLITLTLPKARTFLLKTKTGRGVDKTQVDSISRQLQAE